MGLLDDAIREHLELKRRTGADPAEVERLEREAFGARDEAAAPAANGSADAAPAVAEHVEPPPTPAEADEPYADPHIEQPLPGGDPVVPHEPPPSPAAEPVPDPSAPSREPVEQPTRQFTAAELDDAQRAKPPEAPPREAPASGDAEPANDEAVHDELEETPDFLQETPEHDRLWFEQKPPRDFDF
jgi:hypothetical protein